jgi:DNA-binding transcriptional LysR family regulator
MMDPSLLPALATFVQVAQRRSFTRAASDMDVSRAALSLSLKALEQKLGTRLLYRTTRDMSLTEEGQRLYDAVQPALQSIDQLLRTLGKDQAVPSGLLRINTSRIAAKTLLEPHMGEFMRRYPDLRLELVMQDGMSNIVADGCDAGIRLGQSLAEHMVAVPITPMMEMAVVGSPAYFKKHGQPSSPQDLMHHNCLGYRQTTSGALFQWEFTEPGAKGQDFTVQPQGTFITNDDDGMVRAAMQGVGLVQHMVIAVHNQLQEGSLIRVLQRWCKPFPGFHIYVPSREQMPAKVRALVDFLVEKREAMKSLKSDR